MEPIGERITPDQHDTRFAYREHLARYLFAQQFVKGLAVLDVACGVGYGSALLADAGARRVVGLE